MVISDTRARKCRTADERMVHSRGRHLYVSSGASNTRWVKRGTNRRERREAKREIRNGMA